MGVMTTSATLAGTRPSRRAAESTAATASATRMRYARRSTVSLGRAHDSSSAGSPSGPPATLVCRRGVHVGTGASGLAHHAAWSAAYATHSLHAARPQFHGAMRVDGGKRK